MTNDLYKDRASRIDTIGGNNDYWRLLGKIADEFKSNRMMDGDWVARCEQEYGFRPIYSDDGGIVGYPKIIDSKKYMFALIKYGG